MRPAARRVIDGVSVLCGAAAIALLFWPVGALRSGATPAAAGPGASSPATLPAVSDGRGWAGAIDSASTSIVGGNVFSSNRQPPTERFSPARADAPPAELAALSPQDDVPSAMTSDADDDAVPALFGIVSLDGTPRALMSLRAGDVPRLFRVGDRHAGFVITRIEGDRVTVSSSAGPRTMRLSRPALRDTSENPL